MVPSMPTKRSSGEPKQIPDGGIVFRATGKRVQWQLWQDMPLRLQGFLTTGCSTYPNQFLRPQRVHSPTFWTNCRLCEPWSWSYPHRCANAWALIRPTVMSDTRAAFHVWAADHNFTVPSYEPGDVVIQNRCAKDTFLSHEEYGPVAFSYYNQIPKQTTRIFIVTDLVAKTDICRMLLETQQRHLQRRFPNANITVVGGSLHEDFARLMYAPRLLKSASSSFGLWAAMANTGRVWSTPLTEDFSSHNLTPFFGPKWHWSTAPVLYPSVAKRFNLTLQDPHAIMRWLEQY